MVVLTANDNPLTQVWLNGCDISAYATRCKVPDKPHRIGLGWADLIVGTVDGPIMTARVDENGELVTHRKYGFVRWAPTDY